MLIVMEEKPVVKTNLYRCTEPCVTCPFYNDIGLDKNRIPEIKKSLLKGESFVCHKTFYNLSNDDRGDTVEQEPKMCYGAYEFLKKKDKPNTIMQIAERLGYEES